MNIGDIMNRRIALLWMRLGPYHIARASSASRELEALGASLHVAEVCSRDHYSWAPADECRNVRVETLFKDRDYQSLRADEISSRVTDWLNELNPDVVVANGWSVAEARAALAWANRSTSRLSIVMSETKRDESRRVFWKEFAKRRILRGVSSGLVGGEMQARYLASLGVARDRIYLGYNAVDNDYFIEKSDLARIQSPPFEGRPYFFACSRFIARKNFDGLLRAYAGYRRIVGSLAWGLVISGSGDEEVALRRLSATLGVDEHVHWLGFLQYHDLPFWYAHAGAFVHPAKSEPWGLVVNEAAACGLPLVVATPVGARYELVEDKVNGIVFDPFSDAEMVKALLHVSSLSESDRNLMGLIARRRVADFGPARFSSGLVLAVQAALSVGK